jgi:hypothetical protein
MTRVKNGAVIPTRKLQFVAQELLEDPENMTLEVVSVKGAKGKAFVTLMDGEGYDTPTRKEVLTLAAPIDNIAALKADYATGGLDSEAKIITALNATNTKFNTLIAALIAEGFMASAD